jgi:hypothetical protein
MKPFIKTLLGLKLIVTVCLFLAWYILREINQDVRFLILASVALVFYPSIAVAMLISNQKTHKKEEETLKPNTSEKITIRNLHANGYGGKRRSP